MSTPPAVPNPLTPGERFWRLLRPDRHEIRNVYVYSIFNGMVTLSLPLGIQAIVNLIQGGQVSTSWIVLVTLVVLGIALTGLLQIFQLRITEDLQQKIFTRAAFEFAYRLPKIKMEALYRQYAPELMNRFFDTITVQKGLSKILIDFSAALLQILFGLLLLSFYHPFFIFFGLVLLLLMMAIFQFTGKKGLRTSLEESKFKYKVAHWLEELARTITTFKLAGNTQLHLNRTDEQVKGYLNARESHFKVLVQQYSLLVGFKVLVATGLLAIGGILVMEQQMNIGQFVAAEIIILMVLNSVEKLVLSLDTIYDVLTSLEKVGQVTDLELEQKQGIDLKEQCGEAGITLEVAEVYFNYPGSERKVLDGMSLKVDCQEKLMITGGNGAGKSTLLYLMAGLYSPDQGNIIYNGLPVGNLNPDGLRAVVGSCLADESLFEGTVMENIAVGRPAATFENVQWAVKNLGLETYIKSLPKGYDAPIDPEGRRLPRSTIQKLLLARSIVARPQLLLLEEALEQIVVQERQQIIDFLTDAQQPWTLIAVSSDPYLAEKCNRVALLSNGKVKAIGNQRDLQLVNPLIPTSNA